MKRIYKRVLALALALFMVITLLPTTSLTAQAETQGGTATFKVGGTTYDNLQDAIDATDNSSDKKIVLTNNGTITGDYTIPVGVTLLIPFDEAGTCITNAAAPIGGTNDWVSPVPYKTLTMAQGSSITVEGAISVSAKHAAAGGSKTYGMSPSGTYGYMVMEEDSHITVKSGGNLYVYGFISGKGDITAESGANVYENMQISEFRGGTIISQWDVNHEVFPFSQYYAQNIEVPLTLEYGAQELVFGSAYMKNTTFSMLASFMGTEGLFTLGEGTTITKYYDPDTDRLHVESDGNIQLNGMHIGLGDDTIRLSIDSRDFVLPINSNITIKINSGTVTMNQDVALLPGAEFILEENATLNVAQGTNLYIYDRDQWIRKCSSSELGFVFDNKNFVPVIYTPTERYIRTDADLVDAVLDVNGTVNAYGNIYTTVDTNYGTGGASIISSKGTGKIHYISAAGEKVYTNQVAQVSNQTIAPIAIGVAPALLKNADGSYVATKGAAAGTTYSWNTTSDGWVKEGQHPVVFDTVGGSKVATAYVDKNATLDAPTAPTKEGYTFKGWMDAKGNAVTFPITVTEDTVLTADWAVNTYTITFVDTDGTEIKTEALEYGQPVVAPTPTKVGYDFAGWDVKVPSTMPAKNLTLKATWVVKTYTLSFVDTDGSVIKNITQAYNTAVTAPVNPTKPGYTFQGWMDGNGNPIDATDLPAKMPAENMTYTASWKVNQYTITFNTNGAGDLAPITADFGASIKMPANPEKVGYTFQYWIDQDAARVDTLTTMPAKSLELTAKWQINQYSIAFMDTDGTTAVLPTITQDYNTTIVAPTTPVKEGHTFTGWVDAEGKAAQVPTIMAAKDTTLYATWSVNKYTITFYLDGGVGQKAITADYGWSLSAVSDPTKEGYDFLGWMDESGNMVSVPATMPAKNMELTAKWGVKQQTLTFVDTDGTVLDQIKAEYGATITAPAEPVKEGYTFVGWVDENGASTQIPDKMPEEDATFKASWEVNQYKITFKTNEGLLSSAYIDFGAAITVPEVPTREGYEFTGWDMEVPETMPAGNLVFTATWDVLSYKVVWLDEEGTLLDEATVQYGEDAIYGGTTPVKSVESGETGYYVHSGWVLSDTVYEDADYVYVAKFLKVELGQYYVVFEDVNGAEMGVAAYSAGASIQEPETPTKEGYTFKEWVDGNGEPITFPMTMPAYNLYGDTAIKATWTPNTYTITYIFADNDFETLDVVFGKAVDGPSKQPYKEGYVFEGWNIEIPEIMPAKDLVATAMWSIEQYVIDFETNDGSYIAPMVLAFGTSINELPIPTKDGYTFAGWVDAYGDAVTLPMTMPAEDLVLEATWEVVKYDIHYYIDADTWYQTDSYEFGEEIDEPIAPTKEGYTFAGWDITIPETMQAKDLIVVARWTANDYTITYDVDGDVSSVIAAYESAIAAPATPSKEGYTFAGWADANGKKVEIPSTMPLGGLKVFASWDVNSYTLTFNTNGGSDIASVTYDYMESVVVPANPTKVGYTFVGWTDSDGVVVELPETMPAADITLTAKWQINEYKITFNTDGGSVVPEIKADYGENIVAPANPGKEGYTFVGWDTEIPKTMPANNVTINAVWKINQYTVVFNSMGGTEVASVTADYKSDVNAPVAPTKVGYTFVAWVDNAGNAVSFPLKMPVDGMELKATWKINQYTVTFDTDGGSAVAAATVDYGAMVEKPANPEKDNHTFAGWVDAAGNPVEFPITVGTENITVKAKWILHKKMISWDYNGDGSTDLTTEVDYGTTAAVLASTYAPAAGKNADAEYTYEFDGWSPDLVDVTNDAVYYAKFKSIPNVYTVTIDANGGNLAETSRDCQYGTSVKQPNTPIREGYTFAYWVDAATGQKLDFPFNMPAKDITIKASWNVNVYKIGWDVDGDGTVDEKVDVNHGVLPTHAAGVKAKDAEYTYTFTGWSPSVVAATKDAAYYAQFKATPNVYTIKFVDTDGKVISSQNVAYGNAVIVPANPTKVGYTFAEWDMKIPDKMPAKDVTITAKWIANTYVVDWDMDGDGKIDDSTDEAYGTTPTHNYIQKPETNKYTYNFIGWDANQDGIVDGIKPVTGDATYTAVFEAVKKPVKEELVRISGKTRYDTSLAIADQLKAVLEVDKFDTIVIASGKNFPDALAGSYLAAEKDAPILMTDSKSNLDDLYQYIDNNFNTKGKIYILGGESAVSEDVLKALEKKGYDVERLKGGDRYITNIEILKETGTNGKEILVCTGAGFADSLSASAADLPILLVNGKGKLTKEQKEYLATLKGSKFCIIGGEGVVNATIENELKAYGTVERVSGSSRYETSVKLAERYFDKPDTAVIAYAWNYPDGLCGGPLAAKLNAPLILTGADRTNGKKPTTEVEVEAAAAAERYVNTYQIKRGIALGGAGALSDYTVNMIFDLK